MGDMGLFFEKLEMLVRSVSLILPYFPARKLSKTPIVGSSALLVLWASYDKIALWMIRCWSGLA